MKNTKQIAEIYVKVNEKFESIGFSTITMYDPLVVTSCISNDIYDIELNYSIFPSDNNTEITIVVWKKDIKTDKYNVELAKKFSSVDEQIKFFNEYMTIHIIGER